MTMSFCGHGFTGIQRGLLDVVRSWINPNRAFAIAAAYFDAWQCMDFHRAIPLAVANRLFGKEAMEPIIEEINEALVA